MVVNQLNLDCKCRCLYNLKCYAKQNPLMPFLHLELLVVLLTIKCLFDENRLEKSAKIF